MEVTPMSKQFKQQSPSVSTAAWKGITRHGLINKLEVIFTVWRFICKTCKNANEVCSVLFKYVIAYIKTPTCKKQSSSDSPLFVSWDSSSSEAAPGSLLLLFIPADNGDGADMWFTDQARCCRRIQLSKVPQCEHQLPVIRFKINL